MTILGIIVGIVFALLALKFIKGAIKFAVLGAAILIALFLAYGVR